jgi:hypothetical protein
MQAADRADVFQHNERFPQSEVKAPGTDHLSPAKPGELAMLAGLRVGKSERRPHSQKELIHIP